MNIPPKYEDVVAQLEFLREGIIALNPESVLKQEADYLDHIADLQQRLAVAEQRAVEMERLLRDASAWIKRNSCHGTDAIELWERIDAALKPAEVREGK